MNQGFKTFSDKVNQKRTCLQCDRIIRGRSDKKFCDDYCRSAHNNKSTVSKQGHIRAITRRLIKNRIILEKWSDKKNSPIHLNDLLSEGFTLSYATEFISQPVGNPFIFCFEYGYQLLPGNRCRIIQKKIKALNN